MNRDFVLLQNELRSGSIGTPYLIESRVNGSRGIPAGWRTTRAHGGGMLYDWGVHLIDQIMHFDKSPVVHVYCRKHSVRYKDVDDYFHLDISFEDGLTATIEVGTNNFIPQPRWLAYGTDGTLRIDSWDCSGKVVRCLDREDKWMPDVLDNGRLGPSKTMAARSETSVTTRELSMPAGVNDTIEPTYLQLIDAMEGKNELTIKPEEALRVIKVIEAANRSSSENSVIHCTI